MSLGGGVGQQDKSVVTGFCQNFREARNAKALFKESKRESRVVEAFAGHVLPGFHLQFSQYRETRDPKLIF